MAPLVFIVPLVLIAVGLIVAARGVQKRVDARWKSFAATTGGAFTPRSKGVAPAIDLVRSGSAVRLTVFVGVGMYQGRRRAYNELRVIVRPPVSPGYSFCQLYMPSLHPEPVFTGDESPIVASWLAAVDAEVRGRPGTTIRSEGDEIFVGLERKGDKLEDFERMLAIGTKLADAVAASSVMSQNAREHAGLGPVRNF